MKSEFEDIMYDVLGLLIPGIMANLIIGYEIFLMHTNSKYFEIESCVKYMQIISSIKVTPITIIIGLVSSYLVSTVLLGFFGVLDKLLYRFEFVSFFSIKKLFLNNYEKCMNIVRGDKDENNGITLFIDPKKPSSKNNVKKKFTSKIKFYETITYILRAYFWYQFIQGILEPTALFSNTVIKSYGLFWYIVFMISIVLFTDLIYLSQLYHKFLKEECKNND